MRLSIDKPQLTAYVRGQVNCFFPDGQVTDGDFLGYVDKALQRLEYCFSHVKLKYYFDGKHAVFNHFNTDQYAAFLYFLSNCIYRGGGDLNLATKVYALNKALHAIDVFYEVQLPDIFFFQHPVGTVLGRAKFSNYFAVYQYCCIGSNLDCVFPTLGEGVVMWGNSALVGKCTVGNNCWLSFGTQIMDSDVPSNMIAFGKSPNIVTKPTQRNVLKEAFGLTDLFAP